MEVSWKSNSPILSVDSELEIGLQERTLRAVSRRKYQVKESSAARSLQNTYLSRVLVFWRLRIDKTNREESARKKSQRSCTVVVVRYTMSGEAYRH